MQLNHQLHSQIQEALKPIEGVAEIDPDLDILYKQWFDNVEEYFERKKQREQLLKNKKQKKESSVRVQETADGL